MTAAMPKGTPTAAMTDELHAVARAIGDLRRGVPIVLRDENRALLVLASELITAELLERLAIEGPPLLVLTANRAAVLHVPPTGDDVVTIAADQLAIDTIRSLGDATSDLNNPLRGPFRTAGHHPLATSAVRLCKVARLLPAPMVVAVEALRVGTGYLVVSANSILAYEENAARSLTIVSSAQVPLADAANVRIVAFRPSDGGVEHVAIIVGEPSSDMPPLVRLHSECFTGDLLASLRCDCGDQLRGAITLFAQGNGEILLYLAQEGRGIGLINKLRAYALQDQGFDTMEANRRLGFEEDERVFLPAAEMLRRLGVPRVRLLTNNPEKVAGLERCGIAVTERVGHAFPANPHNQRYLATKAERGHLL